MNGMGLLTTTCNNSVLRMPYGPQVLVVYEKPSKVTFPGNFTEHVG